MPINYEYWMPNRHIYHQEKKIQVHSRKSPADVFDILKIFNGKYLYGLCDQFVFWASRDKRETEGGSKEILCTMILCNQTFY